MSADRRSDCPNCKNLAKIKEKELNNQFTSEITKGNVTEASEFLEKLKKINMNPGEYKFQEWYEIYMHNDGLLIISYDCECEECGWKHSLYESHDAFKATGAMKLFKE